MVLQFQPYYSLNLTPVATIYSLNIAKARTQIFLKSSEESSYLKKIFKEDLLKISKRILNEIFLISRARTAPYICHGW